jgi:hypothetical protein
MARQILVDNCGECPYFGEGEISQRGERWTNDSCLKGYGQIYDKNYILETCELERALFELM